MKSALWTTMALLALLGSAEAQEATPQRIEVRVTAVSGTSVHIDRGSDDRLEPGDVVRLLPIGSPETSAVVRSVTRMSARCELKSGTGIEVGVRGEVLIPSGRAPNASEHQPWSYPPEEWNEEMPLLAPPRALLAAERETSISGRWYNQFDSTWDGQDDNRYLLGRSGIDLLVENPFKRGGGLHFDAELFSRMSQFDNGPDENDTEFRLDRLSYYWGGVRESPRRFEVGRFLQREFPEFGVLDGMEFTQRLSSGSRVGGSIGFLPEPFPEMKTGEDLQLSGYYKHFSGEEDELTLGIGAQKTWHDGAADRDLVATTAEWRPNERFSLYATSWIDFYDAGDVIKSSGIELTELHLNGSYRFESGNGLGLGLSRVLWPELKRQEFTPITANELNDSELTRLYLHGWRKLSKDVRLSARTNTWTDEDDSGSGGELRLGWRDLLIRDGEMGFEVFVNDGSFSSVVGGRVTATKATGENYWNLAWEVAEYQQNGFAGSQENLLQQDLRLGWDRYFQSGWNVSVSADQRFGDEQNALSLGFFVQRRF